VSRITVVQRDFAMALDSELRWLRPRVIRMRALLRYAQDRHIERGLKELISDAEDRLDALEDEARTEKLIPKARKSPPHSS
jgi:hypothetical protein